MRQYKADWVIVGPNYKTQRYRPDGARATGNPEQWALETVANPSCQDEVDTKAFTGRGKLYELRHLLARLAAATNRMEALSAHSKSLIDTGMCLVLHRRIVSGYTFLRWRTRTDGDRHLSWKDAEARIDSLPPMQQRWCADASDLAKWLNSEHLTLRGEIRKLRALLSRTQSHLYARSLPKE